MEHALTNAVDDRARAAPHAFPDAGQDQGIATPATCVPWGLAILDPNGQIEFANRRARCFMEQSDGLSDRGGLLTVERSGIQRRLLAMIADISRLECPDEPVLGVPGHGGSIRYAIRLVPCENAEVFGEGRVLAAISDLREGSRQTRREISAIFGLSEREAEFAAHFAMGMRVCDIASAMSIALNTARVHLRHVFAKTGTRGQLELARAFARLP